MFNAFEKADAFFDYAGKLCVLDLIFLDKRAVLFCRFKEKQRTVLIVD